MPDDAGCTEQVSRQETYMRGQSPLVSVIMRSHNDGEYVDEAIKSVLTQTYQHLELVIVNDGSTDSTFDRVEYLAPHGRTGAAYPQQTQPWRTRKRKHCARRGAWRIRCKS